MVIPLSLDALSAIKRSQACDGATVRFSQHHQGSRSDEVNRSRRGRASSKPLIGQWPQLLVLTSEPGPPWKGPSADHPLPSVDSATIGRLEETQETLKGTITSPPPPLAFSARAPLCTPLMDEVACSSSHLPIPFFVQVLTLPTSAWLPPRSSIHTIHTIGEHVQPWAAPGEAMHPCITPTLAHHLRVSALLCCGDWPPSFQSFLLFLDGFVSFFTSRWSCFLKYFVSILNQQYQTPRLVPDSLLGPASFRPAKSRPLLPWLASRDRQDRPS